MDIVGLRFSASAKAIRHPKTDFEVMCTLHINQKADLRPFILMAVISISDPVAFIIIQYEIVQRKCLY